MINWAFLIYLLLAFIKVGGYTQLQEKYMNSFPDSIPPHLAECAAPNPHAFQMLRSIDDPDMPWLGFILGQTPASIW